VAHSLLLLLIQQGLQCPPLALTVAANCSSVTANRIGAQTINITTPDGKTDTLTITAMPQLQALGTSSTTSTQGSVASIW
jgi:hypothetical protein